MSQQIPSTSAPSVSFQQAPSMGSSVPGEDQSAPDGLSKLYVEPTHLVAFGRQMPGRSDIHCRKILATEVVVEVVNVVDPSASLPIPVPEALEIVGQALSEYVAWPIRLIDMVLLSLH